MELLFFVLLMIVGIVVSSVANKYLPRVPLALIQISVGVLMTFLPLEHEVILEPEIFMLCIIAPLVFYEGQKVSRKEFWELKGPILLLAFGLVLISVILGGFVIQWLIPKMPLAIAFALAAIISPTDTVALKSIVKNIKLPDNIMGVLEGESLINDAAGLVSFKVALAAVVTGVFSVKEASISFLVAAFGGIVLGVIMGLLFVKLRIKLRKMGLEESELLILIQLATPFVIFILAEEFNFSGILALVAAGFVHGFEQDKLQKTTTKLQLISSNVWSTFIYFLNSLVFLLLGSMLPSVIKAIWDANDVHVAELLGSSLLIFCFILFLRFAWVYLLYADFVEPVDAGFSNYLIQMTSALEPAKKSGISRFKYAVITAFAGVHGTISLATALSVPLVLGNNEVFPLRNEVLFITASVILFSLISATIMLPLLVPKEQVTTDLVINAKKLDEITGYQEILFRTIDRLEQQRTAENNTMLNQILLELEDKLVASKEGRYRDEDRGKMQEIMNFARDIEKQKIDELIAEKQISPMIERLYQVYLENSRRFEERNFFKIMLFKIKMNLLKKRVKKMRNQEFDARFKSKIDAHSQLIEEFKESQRLVAGTVVQEIQNQMTSENRKESIEVMERYNRRTEYVQLDSAIQQQNMRRLASLTLQIEREEIQRLLDNAEINFEIANQLGEQVTYDELSELTMGTE
ncbi:Na+/H+ antiporter [Carnobacterium gallinarum]|uniref:Na+/H+ antiporter n=1 Tax=Carnobacterium gallinarum TaxID=2749 RepID=UPI0005528988|nr:Na+/H+ antiporter [Carnobacterium gallinarum]